ncbi:hypothetical protein PRUB_a0525 [Pseudoalteromonas rubra]|uniref:Lipoprotein n=1 Tax=Pseudoalteromonas rubra TaxID=43658 RepID=A0A8T0C5Q5_9GAMM|nr:hypothetical protein [Pseudoalteromonas rubra]KAF7786074.1 hypothetical protein PRUB_a0525 [Pseudoalteromonas rubra]
MMKIYLLSLCFLLTACATNKNEKVEVTGQRISKEEAKKLNLKPVGTIQDLINSHLAGLPRPGDFENCQELLQQLKRKGMTIQSVKEKQVVAVTKANKLITYNFKDGSCLD